MYTLWLTPPDKPSADLAEHTFGKHLRSRARKVAVAIIGVDGEIAQKTRDHLYATSWDFDKLAVRDLGNLRKTTPDFIIPLLRELHSGGITPVLIGGDDQVFVAQYLAFAEINRQVSLLHIDRTIPLSAEKGGKNILDNAVYDKGRRRFHLTHLGAQQHLTNPALRDIFNSEAYEAVSLGQVKASLPALEPLLRDADLVGLNIRAINHNEAPARAGFHPSGLSLQEATQLAYYAGNSDKLSSYGLYGLDPSVGSATDFELTAAAYAQLIWYFLHGFSRRQGDFPVSNKGLLEYVVDLQGYNQLTFWRSPRSNRWWVQVPAGKQQGEERHRLVPCSYQDYLTASSEQTLPDRLIAAFRRFA